MEGERDETESVERKLVEESPRGRGGRPISYPGASMRFVRIALSGIVLAAVAAAGGGCAALSLGPDDSARLATAPPTPPAPPTPVPPPVALDGPQLALDDLVAEARRANPEIRAATARVAAAQARIPQASALPDPLFSAGYSNEAFNQLTLGQRDGSNIGLSVSQDVPFPPKLVLRGRIAALEAQREQEIARATELDVVSRLRVAYYELFFVEQSIAIVQKNRDLLDRFARTAEARYSVGRATQADVLRAQTEITILLERLASLEQQRESLRAAINSLLNRPRDAALGSPVEPPRRALPVTFDQLADAALRTSPDLRAAERAADRNVSNLDLARKQYYPDFTLGTGYVNRGGLPGMWQITFGLTLPVYFRVKQDYGVREATSALEGSRADVEATRQALFANLRDQYARAQASGRLLELIGTGALPQATLTLESSVASYTVGRVDFLTLLTNLLNVLNQELQYYQELTNFEASLARLERLAGRPLTP